MTVLLGMHLSPIVVLSCSKLVSVSLLVHLGMHYVWHAIVVFSTFGALLDSLQKRWCWGQGADNTGD